MNRESIEADLVIHDRALRATREDLADARMRVETLPTVINAIKDMIGSLRAYLAIIDATPRPAQDGAK